MIKKVVFLSLMVLASIAIIGYWQKEKIMALLYPAGVQTPMFSQPADYLIVELLEKNGLVVETAPVFLSDAIIASVAGVSVFFSPEKEPGAQVRALQLVLPKLTMEDRKVKEIDLRFNKVVIRY